MGPLRFPESVSDPAAVVRKALAEKINVLCITDHNSTAGAMKALEAAKSIPGIEVIMGEEVTTADGEVLALFINEEIPAGLSIEDTMDRIRSQDGLAVAPHPFSLHCPCLGERINDIGLDGIEVLNGGHIDDYANARAQKEALSGKFARTGGSDSHYLPTVGMAYTTFEGGTAEELRQAILGKRTDAGGRVIPMDKAIAWSMSVIATSDKYILRSFLGLDKEPTDDPIIARVQTLKLGQKLGALTGSFVYLLPPIPFLMGIISQKLFRVQAEKQENGKSSVLGRLGHFY
ncbi:MAG: PHP domain-containing protein [Methanomassiliicoccus sp.]|nr:PHP domain-containing protein [Methanomassiliicoccus sp.]